jgi:hypothetical protein
MRQLLAGLQEIKKKKMNEIFLGFAPVLLGNPERFFCTGQQAVDQYQSADNDD